MTLHEKQTTFLQNVAKLILWAFENGYELIGGELLRTEDQQKIYLAKGLSKIKRSKHQDSLAIDLCLFIKGVYITDTKQYKPLADYWKSLNPNNVAGYDWGWDGNHFEMS